MSQYSELIGSFLRTGPFPLEADYIFSSEDELILFYEDPINKSIIHQGQFKIVGEGEEQSLYWVVKQGNELKFVKLLKGIDNKSIVEDSWYDSTTENIIFIIKLYNGQSLRIEIPARDIINEIDVESTESIYLLKDPVKENGPDIITARLKISSDVDNAITLNSSGVFVKDHTETINSKASITYVGKSINDALFETNSYESVDMGEAGVWATCNIGANKPHEVGLYFSWAEVEGYSNPQEKGGFSWDTYKYGKFANLTKYNFMSQHGSIDNIGSLEEEDDAAHIKMEGAWYIPSRLDYKKLVDACNTEFTWDYNKTGVPGRIFRLKTDNTKELFFPITGYIDNYYLGGNNEGHYWTSWVRTDYCPYAYSFYLDNLRTNTDYYTSRYTGIAIRAMLDTSKLKYLNKEEADKIYATKESVDNIESINKEEINNIILNTINDKLLNLSLEYISANSSDNFLQLLSIATGGTWKKEWDNNLNIYKFKHEGDYNFLTRDDIIFTGFEHIFAYGVEWDITVSDPHITRIGNPILHKTLPILSQLKGCIALGGKIIYWLDENDWRFRKNPNKIEVNLTESTTKIKVENLKSLNLEVGQYLRNGENIAKITTVDTTASVIDVTWESSTANISQITSLEIGSRLDGYDGTVRVYCPGFYIKSSIEDNKRRVLISTIKIDNTWIYLPEILIDAYFSAVLNSIPANMGYLSTLPRNSAISVVNTNSYCRGLIDNSIYDKYLNSDPCKTSLGKPATNITRANMRTYSRNSGSEVLSYDLYKNIFYWLIVIEYANFNVQEEFNENLTEEGYHQGGLGKGVVGDYTASSSLYNNQAPYTPCGYLNHLGNRTGIKEITRPLFEAFVADTLLISRYTANTSGATSTVDSANKVRTFTNIKSTTTSILTASYSRIAKIVTYKTTGLLEGQSLRFEQGTGSSISSYGVLEGNGGEQTIRIEWPDNMNDREIRASFTGPCNFTFQVNSIEQGAINIPSNTFNVPRWRGFDNPFGDIFMNLDGVIIDANDHSDNMNYIYTCQDPNKYSDSLNDSYKKVGEEIHTEGFIKEFDLGTEAHIIPNINGGNSTLYKCDYHWVGSKNSNLRTVLIGGDINHNNDGGLIGWVSSQPVTVGANYYGFRSVSSPVSFLDNNS